MKEQPKSQNLEQSPEETGKKEKPAEMTFEEAVSSLIQEKMKEEGEKKEQPTLVAVYGEPHAGKSEFIKKVLEELSKDEKNKYFVGRIQTSDDPEGDLKQFEEMKREYPGYKAPFIFFHGISLGEVDQFALEHFKKAADKNLYFFNSKRQKIDRTMIKKELEKSRKAWTEFYHQSAPEPEVTFVSNPGSKVKKL